MRCPVCRAENSQGPQCRRCRADLSLLWRLEEERRRYAETAKRLAARGELGRALAVADGVDALRHGPDSAQLLAVIHLLRGDFAAAWRSYENVKSAKLER